MRYINYASRGMQFEQLINYTNTIYANNNLALIQKIPTPIRPVSTNKNDGTISLAYFERKSTVDYMGVFQGRPICFDAKETKLKNLPLRNIQEHQIKFMDKFAQQKGLSFLLVHFVFNDTYFCLPFKTLKKFLLDKNGPKSIPYDKFKYQVFTRGKYVLDYLDTIKKMLALNKANRGDNNATTNK